MTWSRLAIIVFWVVVITLLVQAVASSVLNTPELKRRPFAPPPVVATPHGPFIDIQDYKIEIVDTYRFNVTYTVANLGDQTAKRIRLHVAPWLAHFNNDLPGEILIEDPDDPRLKEEQIDSIDILKPGEKIERILSFTNDGRVSPAGLQPGETFQLEFETVP